MSSYQRSCRGAGLAGPPLPVLAVWRVLEFTAVLTDVEAVVVQDFEQRIEAVTPADVQRVAKKYLGEKNRTVAVLIPEAEAAK